MCSTNSTSRCVPVSGRTSSRRSCVSTSSAGVSLLFDVDRRPCAAVGTRSQAGGGKECACGVRLLGPVEIESGGQILPVPGLRRKALLAILGLRPGRIVSNDRLIDDVWDDSVPATTPRAANAAVIRSRRVADRPTSPIGSDLWERSRDDDQSTWDGFQGAVAPAPM